MAADWVSSFGSLNLACGGSVLHLSPLEIAWHSYKAAIAHGKVCVSIRACLGASARSSNLDGLPGYGHCLAGVSLLDGGHCDGGGGGHGVDGGCGGAGGAWSPRVEALGRGASDSDSSERKDLKREED